MGASSGGASPVLLARINEKKQELANLKELQALSGGLADQMEMLEKKLSTLSDGTEVKIPKPKQTEEEEGAEDTPEEVPLPQTLVRIPTQHAAPLLQQASSGNPAE
ncbi:DASH complex subunit dad2 [Diplodia intermedia]|uniref:DASH complex subunit DAD2 n=1 Tax=Diplodia intermedia TaxID=856260 RepID=A0ABR3TNF0_9PEZI